MTDFYGIYGQICDTYYMLIDNSKNRFDQICSKCFKEKCKNQSYPQNPDTTQLCKTFNSDCIQRKTCTTEQKCQITSFVWQQLIVLNDYIDGWFEVFYTISNNRPPIDNVPCIPPPTYSNYWISDCNESNCVQYLQYALNYLNVKRKDTEDRLYYIFDTPECKNSDNNDDDNDNTDNKGGFLKFFLWVLLPIFLPIIVFLAYGSFQIFFLRRRYVPVSSAGTPQRRMTKSQWQQSLQYAKEKLLSQKRQ